MSEDLPTTQPKLSEAGLDTADQILNDSQLSLGNAGSTTQVDESMRQAEKPTRLHEETVVSLNDSASDGDIAEQRADGRSEKEQRLELAEQWLGTQTKRLTDNHSDAEDAVANGAPIPAEFEQTEPVPAAIASEVALLSQVRIGMWGRQDIMPDEIGGDTTELKIIRDQALGLAHQLDFGIVKYSDSSELRIRLNAMHEKFTDVDVADLATYLEGDDNAYEYKELYIRNIVADHAPQLLTENIRILMDPTQPLWRATSAHASILLRNRAHGRKLGSYGFDKIPIALPVGDRSEYISEDDEMTKPVSSMSEDELVLYCTPQAIPEVRARGSVLFSELSMPSQEGILTRRLFEIGVKSNDQTIKEQASDRNRELENTSPFEEGDLVHATPSPEFFEEILHHGLQCTESIVGSTPRRIDYPFTVSFLRVDESIAAEASVPTRLERLGNKPYGSINIVLSRDPSSTDYGREQQTTLGETDHARQYQLFGGAPSTEIKRVVIREDIALPTTTEDVIHKIVRNGMFIPVYSGTTGELLFSSQQYDQLVAQEAQTQAT